MRIVDFLSKKPLYGVVASAAPVGLSYSQLVPPLQFASIVLGLGVVVLTFSIKAIELYEKVCRRRS